MPEKLTQKVGFLLFFAEKCKKYTKNAKKTRKNLRISNKSCTFAPSNKIRRGGNPKQRHKIMTTTSKYFNSAEITNVRQTICTLLSELLNAQSFTNKEGHNQVVITLNEEANGDQWLMFVYYDAKRESFYYSFQDQDYNDTVFTYGVGMMDMVEQIEAEIERVHGFEWIEIDID